MSQVDHLKESVNSLGSQLMKSRDLLNKYREYAEHHDTVGMCDELALELGHLTAQSTNLVNTLIPDESGT